jgi:murein DD-endopeptidase MepM/ murein hydrolase activator NlpD
MAILQRRQSTIKRFFLLAGICTIFLSFIAQPVNDHKEPVVNHDLAKYFEPPQLPLDFCNTCIKPVKAKKVKTKKNSGSKRIVTNTNSVALGVPLTISPVIGATKNSIISFYGDARSGGRKHEGIDIVAPKGTIVVAPSEGTITDVSYNILGGKVIWMKDAKEKRTYYFAHLDSQIVAKGTFVKPGDTLGTVGNTGNARRTRSHLHFGIYKNNGRTPADYVRSIRSKDQLAALLAVK